MAVEEKMVIPTPMGDIVVTNGDASEGYKEVFIYIGDAQIARLGYDADGLYRDETGSNENMVLNIWTDGGWEVDQTICFTRDDLAKMFEE